MGKHTSTTAVFVADTHFHLIPEAGERARLNRFLDFLAEIRHVDHLILLGDIFDFWFDYTHFRLKGYDDLLKALDDVHAADVQIHFIGGNHDIWATDYFRERYACTEDTGPLTLDLDGLRFRLDHGDGLLNRDYVYKTFRSMVRNRAGIIFAKSFHPEMLYAFSRWLSRTSRKAYREEGVRLEELAAEYLSRVLADWDIMVIGHVHHAMDLKAGGRRLLALGGWLDQESYAVFHGGRLTLHDYRDGFPDLEVLGETS